MTERNDAKRYFQEDIESDKLVPEGIEGRVPYKVSYKRNKSTRGWLKTKYGICRL